MLTDYFETSVHAKCILAGEHTVLRGGPALVLPVYSKKIILDYDPADKITILSDMKYEPVLSSLFYQILKHALLTIKKNLFEVNGTFVLTNSIAIGEGLGFSAAICLSIANFFVYKKWLDQHAVFNFAHKLEQFFHGISSGVDVVGVMSKYPVYYELNHEPQVVKPLWRPHLYLSCSGFSKNTSLAIHTVCSIVQNQPLLAAKIDEEMKQSALMIKKSLTSNSQSGLPLLIKAIEQAKECFLQWGLISAEMQKKIDELYSFGALSVKPTGAGGGGYLLSLWNQDPPETEEIVFEDVFER